MNAAKLLTALALPVWSCTVALSQVVITLPGAGYTENFDSIGTALPNGWNVYTGATTTSLGTVGTYSTTKTQWTSPSDGFHNYAAPEAPLTEAATLGEQTAATDRALGFRQSDTFGDPGASIFLGLQNTTGLQDFSLTLKLQTAREAGRSTPIVVDYRVGTSGPFTSLYTTTTVDIGTLAAGTWGSVSTGTLDFGNALDNQSANVFIRISALAASTGVGNRDTFTIDDVVLSYTAVPEPQTYALFAGLSLVGFGLWRRARR